MIIGSGMGGLLMAELLGTLEVLRFIIFTSWTSYFYCKGAAILFFGELLTTAYGSE